MSVWRVCVCVCAWWWKEGREREAYDYPGFEVVEGWGEGHGVAD